MSPSTIVTTGSITLVHALGPAGLVDEYRLFVYRVISQTDLDAYLARLGLEAEPPSVDGLFRLHPTVRTRTAWPTTWS